VSARREARSRLPVLSSARGGLPAAFALGACMDVWSDHSDRSSWRFHETGQTDANWWSARRRFREAREAWLDSIGVVETADRCRVFPVTACRPWHAEFLIDNGRADDVAARFASAGCALDDIPALAKEAAELHALSKRAAAQRSPTHLKENRR
jgi:hypothetical protein